ncbi:MAG TPA: RNB domain-containing ribonuclease [Gaiellaceae bacterium]|nr:RNB domain-containing ribonuclease [Gaiellaceae bacterium]
MGDRVVAEVATRGKLVVGEPYFTPGVPIVLDRKALRGAERGDLVVVSSGRGRAKVERVLGRADRIEAVLEGLLAEKGARTSFEPFDERPPDTEGRADLRDLPTFTIDPDTAKDFDDAISVRRESDGVRAWVHIADVSYFVPAGSSLDHGAAGRAFSTYLPGLVAPMLPPALSDDLCSLRPGVDRLCVTVEFPPGYLGPAPPPSSGEPSFYRSVIRSDARLTYGQAQRREVPAEVAGELELAAVLSAELRRRRFARGALRVESPELEFEFDGEGGVARAWRQGEPEAHALVEELMIVANEAVAGLLAGRRREALYRVHERPDPQAIDLLLAKLADLEVPTPPAREQLTPADAARLAAETSERVAEYVRQSGRGRDAFPAMVLQALKQARYDPRNLGHSGLASPAYCHFTSPIRRYPDLVVHRALLHELGQSEEPAPADLGDLAEHASAREREAAQLEYLADEICLAWLLERELFGRGWEEPWPGEITGVIGSGLFVRFGDVFEGYLPARRLPGDYFELNTLGTALVGRRGGGVFRLGDPISVRVEEIRRSEGKVELSLGDARARGEPRTQGRARRSSDRRPRS